MYSLLIYSETLSFIITNSYGSKSNTIYTVFYHVWCICCGCYASSSSWLYCTIYYLISWLWHTPASLVVSATPGMLPLPLTTSVAQNFIASIKINIHFSGVFVVPLLNTHQIISLKLTNNNYLYWRMQMKPYFLG